MATIRSTSSKKRKRLEKEKDLVSINNSYRVNLNQPKIQLLKHSAVVHGLGRFLQIVSEQGERVFEEWPAELNSMLALMVQESDKDLGRLARFVHGELFPSISAGLSNENDEFSESKKLLPLSVLEKRINELATRVNYGIVNEQNTTAHGSLWRWEINDFSCLNIPEDVVSLLKDRQQEREKARAMLLDTVSLWDSETWNAYFTAGKKQKNNSGQRLPLPVLCSSPPSSAVDSCSSPTVDLCTNDDAKVCRSNLGACSSPLGPTSNLVSSPSSPSMRNLATLDGMPLSSPTTKVTKRGLQLQKRRERDLEKQRKDDERRKKEGAQSRLVSFFSPIQKKSVATLLNEDEMRENDHYMELFPPYFLRGNVILAKHNQQKPFATTDAGSEAPFKHLHSDFTRLIKQARGRIHALFEEPPKPADDDDVLIIDEHETQSEVLTVEDGDDASENGQRPVCRFRLLQFYENVRPAYWGTWSKTSQLIRPKRPFGLDPGVFDYDYDSEAEWVEGEEDGEELLSEDDDDEEEDEEKARGDEMLDDDWLVPNDYPIEEYEPGDGPLSSPIKAAAPRPESTPSMLQTGRRNLATLKPHVIGLYFTDSLDSGDGPLKHLKAESLLPFSLSSISIFDPRYVLPTFSSSTPISNKENMPTLSFAKVPPMEPALPASTSTKAESAVPVSTATKAEPAALAKKPKKRAVITTTPFPTNHPFNQS